MEGVPYIGGCVILSLTAGPTSVSHRNGKMPTFMLHTRETKQNKETVMATPFSLWQAKCWPKSCSPISWSMLQILCCQNLNMVSRVDAAQLK